MAAASGREAALVLRKVRRFGIRSIMAYHRLLCEQERGRRSGFRVLIDFSIPPTYVDTERTILKEVPFDFVLLQPSLEVCAERAGSRQEAAITDYVMLKNFYARLKEGT